MTNKKYGYTLNKRELNKWLKEYDYTYKDLAFELETDARTLRQIVYKRWALTNVKIGKLIEFLGAENAFRIINFKNKEEKDRVFYETFVKPMEDITGYKWQK